MTKLEVKITEYPEYSPQISQAGRYTIQTVKGPQETRYGPSLIAVVTNTKGEERSLFIPHSAEVSNQSNLARLIAGFGDDTQGWLKRKIDVTIGSDGKRRIEPVTTDTGNR
jgi:hypothetical protein